MQDLTEQHFPLETTDIQGLVWSPCGRYLAAYESSLSVRPRHPTKLTTVLALHPLTAWTKFHPLLPFLTFLLGRRVRRSRTGHQDYRLGAWWSTSGYWGMGWESEGVGE
jgi:hypothetical protein